VIGMPKEPDQQSQSNQPATQPGTVGAAAGSPGITATLPTNAAPPERAQEPEEQKPADDLDERLKSADERLRHHVLELRGKLADTRKESADHRRLARRYEEELAQTKARLAEYEQAELRRKGELEKVIEQEKAARADVERRLAEERKLSAVRVWFVAEGGIDPDDARWVPTDGITIDEHGETVGAREAVQALKQAKPYLFRQGQSQQTQEARPTPPVAPRPTPAPELTREQILKMPRSEYQRYKDSYLATLRRGR
jgi:hypothetical protein